MRAGRSPDAASQIARRSQSTLEDGSQTENCEQSQNERHQAERDREVPETEAAAPRGPPAERPALPVGVGGGIELVARPVVAGFVHHAITESRVARSVASSTSTPTRGRPGA